MTDMVICCETSKKDKNALTIDTMLRSPFLMICCAVFILLLAVLPVMQLIALAARGILSPLLLLYIFSLAAMLFVTIRQDGAYLAGTAEYTFSHSSLTVKNEQKSCCMEYSALYRVRESRKYFFLMPSKYSAYILPKEYLTTDEGTRLREIFASKLSGRKCDSFFEGKSAKVLSSFSGKANEISFTLSDSFPSDAAKASLLNIQTAVKMFYMFMLTVLILSQLSVVFGAVLALICQGIALISNLRRGADIIRSRIKDSTVTYRFYGNGFECIISGNSTGVISSDIKAVKKKNTAAVITRKSGRKIIMPVTDEILSMIHNAAEI